MNKKELEAQLEQNKADQQATSARLKEEQASIEAELAGLDKPKLAHGDYGYFATTGRPRLVGRNGVFNSSWSDVGNATSVDDYNITGNIFADLERNSKDLEEFEIHCCSLKDGATIKIDWNTPGRDDFHVVMERDGKRLYMSVRIDEFCQKVNRMRATQIRNQNG